MASYLYVLSIGPVQDFIAAARRTRDLWFGSYILSSISKAAAREIVNSGGILIFPSLNKGDTRLGSYNSDFNVANVILAKLPEGTEDPAAINEKAQRAAKMEWNTIAERARTEGRRAIRQDESGRKIWKDQVDDAIEFYAAWAPEGDYQMAHAKVMRLLAGRKSIRNFNQAEGYFGIPKSSLDGARESVLMRDKSIPKWLSLKMRLSPGEELCAIGLIKRLGKQLDGSNVTFPSVVRVAADPWIRGIRRHPSDEANRLLDKIETCCEGDNSFSTGTGDRLYQDYPFDGQILYPSRLARAKENLKDVLNDSDEGNPFKDQFKADLNKLTQIEKNIHKLQEKDNGGLGFGEPNQYLAILRADGDRMGKALSDIDSCEGHRKFSEQLAGFASKARHIVEDESHGCLVYSGGDDVLAFLPLDTCLKAARSLHYGFEGILKNFPGKKGDPLTLSVGIAIGHYLEPLENLLGFGMEAEAAAKKGKTAEDERDGLAVHIYPRSGAPLKIREKWRPAGKQGLDERLRKWSEMHCRNELPDSAAYEMHELAEDYRDWTTSSENEKEMLRDLIAADAIRLLKRKKGNLTSGTLTKEDIKDMLKGADPYEAVSKLASELILARRIGAAMKQAEGGKSQSNEKPQQEAC